MTTLPKRLTIILLATGMLLLIPLIAMTFTTEVNWSPLDFLVMGVLLVSVALLAEVVWRKVKMATHRIALIVVVLLVFVLIWAELAVGIFGSPFSGS